MNDQGIADQIVDALLKVSEHMPVLEIGPGTGVLTSRFMTLQPERFHAIDIDAESIQLLHQKYPQAIDRFILGDFLKLEPSSLIKEPFALIGNFPYNISTQIVFSVIAHRDAMPLMVGMFQKEVAERIAASPRSKSYGILSVLTQAYFKAEYLFTVNEDVFIPPPKVKSGVIRLTRLKKDHDIDSRHLFMVVKTAFNQRRKKLRNALSSFGISDALLGLNDYINKRAEELSVEDFVILTKLIETHGNLSQGNAQIHKTKDKRD